MRTIQKGTEPHSLTEHRAQAHSDFDNLSDSAKDILREMLVFEQRGICCYCMSRIRPNPDGTKIEHWRPQSRYPTEQLEYRNLLAACMGNEGAPKKMQHCDTFKSDMDLSKNPAEPSHHVEDGIGYKADGSVYSSDPDFDDELNHVLNLNIHFLKTNRKAVLDSFLQSIPRQRVLKRRVLEKWKRDWNGDASIEDLAPYFQVVVFWIEKRLRRV